MASPRARRAVALALAATLALAACGDDDGGAIAPAEESTTTAADGATTTSTPDTTTTTTAASAPEGTVIELELVGGQPAGGPPEAEVPLGDEVTLRVTSDVTDEIHVHGYDLYVDLVAGEEAELSFTADIPGQFEVELHGDGTLLAELTVR